MARSDEVSVPDPLPEYIVDTSVALKWFLNRGEADVTQARNLRDACVEGRCDLRAPELLVIEIANALATGHQRSPSRVAEALEFVRRLELRLETFQWATLANAVRLASSHGVTVYDSYFLAVAVESGRLLVTADEAFVRKVGAHPNIVPLRRLRLPV